MVNYKGCTSFIWYNLFLPLDQQKGISADPPSQDIGRHSSAAQA